MNKSKRTPLATTAAPSAFYKSETHSGVFSFPGLKFPEAHVRDSAWTNGRPTVEPGQPK